MDLTTSSDERPEGRRERRLLVPTQVFVLSLGWRGVGFWTALFSPLKGNEDSDPVVYEGSRSFDSHWTGAGEETGGKGGRETQGW